MISIAPTRNAVQTALRGFLIQILPDGVEVIAGQQNRVPEPVGPDFVVMSPMPGIIRLATNWDAWADVALTGSIAGTVMTVSKLRWGTMDLVDLPIAVWGVGVADGTKITAQLSGPPGGPGQYRVSKSQDVGSGTLACGQFLITQSAQISYQLDVHSAVPGDAAYKNDAADMAQTISTLMRDETATDYFDALDVGVSPLHADDPRFVPFTNAEDQVEYRWVVTADLQANQTVNVPMQFAESAVVTFHPVQ